MTEGPSPMGDQFDSIIAQSGVHNRVPRSQVRAARFDLVDQACAAFDRAWNQYSGADEQPLPLPEDWRQSIRRMALSGVPFWELENAVHTAVQSDVPDDEAFRYFCGIAWKHRGTVRRNGRRRTQERD